MYSLLCQVASDLHLECLRPIDPQRCIEYFSTIIVPNSDILILAGDIGDPTSEIYNLLLWWTSCNWEEVLLITGNHEYYGKTIESTDRHIDELCRQYQNVHFLQKNIYCYRDFMFLGCTLWSHIPLEHQKEVSRGLNDFRKIVDFTMDTYNALNLDHRNWLENCIEEYSGSKILITITHHPMVPDTSLPPRGAGYAFGNDMGHVLKNVDYSISGHTHKNRRCLVGDCKVIINCKGYNIAKDYDPCLTFRLVA